MPDLSQRSTETELMDDLHAGGEVIDITLKELETINLLLGGNYVTTNALTRLLKRVPVNETVMIADIGCGSGDMLRLIRKSLSRKGIKSRLVGIDANPNIIAYARQHTPVEQQITYESINIFSSEFREKKFDVVTGTLFFHHFSDEELVRFFQDLKEQVRIGIVINDIHRHWFAYYSIKWLTALFSTSVMVKNDAPVSVMRAFKKNELKNILQKAGFKRYSIRWMWAFRWQVIIDVRFP
jgi:2-polyprenyl-3-methyl-5-hydroxy-6-metoxy-1,4-benzoquinol methylase